MSVNTKILSYIETYFMGGRKKFNLLKTIYLNFVCLPISQAFKLPIYCYGPIRYSCLRGQIILSGPIKRGCIKIGLDNTKYRTRGTTTLTLLPNSILNFEQNVMVYQGASILVGTNAILVMKENCTLGDEAEIICKKKILIGRNTGITWQCQVTDFNSHFILDMKSRKVSTIYREVHIGNYCWVGNRTTIQPGTVLPSRVIVCSNSLLNKDYYKLGVKENSLIGGMPAKVLKTDVRRIYDKHKEVELLNRFINSDNDIIITENIE